MKRSRTSALVALVLAAALMSTLAVGCRSEETASTGGADGDKIVIGAALCQTGIQAPLDEPALRGAQLAVDELNANGGILGRQVELLNMDGKSDPVTVGNVAKQMIDKGAVAIIAPSDFDFGGPASREAQNAGLVGISPCASSPLYGSAALGDKQFTMSMWNTTMGAATAEYAYDQGCKSVYVITDDFIDYTKSLSRYFIDRYEELGGEVMFEDTYTQGQATSPRSSRASRPCPRQPDFIYISSYMPDLALMIRTFRESGIDVPIVGGDSYDDPALFEALGTAVRQRHRLRHARLPVRCRPIRSTRRSRRPTRRSSMRDPDAVWIMPGYDVVMVLAQAMETAGSTDGRCRDREGHGGRAPSICSPASSTGRMPRSATSRTRLRHW